MKKWNGSSVAATKQHQQKITTTTKKWQSELVLYVDRMKINIYIGSQHLGKFGQTNVKMNERKKIYMQL